MRLSNNAKRASPTDRLIECRPIVSRRFSRPDQSPSSARLPAKRQRAGPCSKIFAEPDFPGTIHLVNPRYDAIEGVRAVKSYDALPEVPDVVAIAVPPAAVPDAVAAAARKGTAVGIIITAGLGHGPGSLAERCEKNARAAGMRLVGPNCLGVLVPRAKLNASFAAAAPPAGDLALISQSGAIAAGLVQWAAARGVGFSAIVSIGDSIDVDFADLLDHFALRSRHARNSAVHRIDQRRPQVHVGGAGRGAHQAGAGHQIGTARARCESGTDAYRRAGRFGCGL